jgi:transposase
MARRYARAPRGERAIASVPYGHWKTTTFIAGLRHDRIDAPYVFDGPINGRRFRAWVEQALGPTLKPGDMVIMDNLPAHKVAGIQEAIEAMGATLLYLPPYSPDLNPIEQVFSKLKDRLRTAAARTVNTLWDTIGESLSAYKAQECANYLSHAGYST